MALSKLLIKVLEPKRTKKLEEALENIDFSKINSLEGLQKIQGDIYNSDIVPNDNAHSMVKAGIITGLTTLPIMASICYYDISQNPDRFTFTLGAYAIMSLGLMIMVGMAGAAFPGSEIFFYFSSAINKEIKKRAKRAGIIGYKRLKREDIGVPAFPP